MILIKNSKNTWLICLIILFILQISQISCQGEVDDQEDEDDLEEYNDQENQLQEQINDFPEDDELIVQQGPRYILKLEQNKKTHQIFSNMHIGSPPMPRRLVIKTEDYGIFVQCYDCETDELNIIKQYNDNSEFEITHRNCTQFQQYYDIHSSDTGKIYNCRQKQFRQRHHCNHCNQNGRCEYAYKPENSQQSIIGLQGEDYFLINENVDLNDFHYMQLNEARTRFPLICIPKYEDGEYHGQLGLADNHQDRFSALNIVSDLSRKKKDTEDTLDICLHPYDGEYPDEIGYIAFGEKSIYQDKDFYLKYHSDKDGYYYINLETIQIGEQNFEQLDFEQLHNSTHTGETLGVMALGTPNLEGPEWFINSILEKFKLECNNNQICQQAQVQEEYEGTQCFSVSDQLSYDDLIKNLPSININTLKNQLGSLSWQPSQYLIQQNETQYCLAMKIKYRTAQLNEINQLVYIGSKFFEGYRVQFQRQNKFINFKKSECIYQKTAKQFVYYNQAYKPVDWEAVQIVLGVAAGLLAMFIIIKCSIKYYKERQLQKKSKFYKFKNDKKNKKKNSYDSD